MEAVERTAEIEAGLVEVIAPLVADRRAAEMVGPGARTLDTPAMPSQPRLVLHALARAGADRSPVWSPGYWRPALPRLARDRSIRSASPS